MPTASQLSTALLIIGSVIFWVFLEAWGTQRFLYDDEKLTKNRLVRIKLSLGILTGLLWVAGFYFLLIGDAAIPKLAH